MAPAPNEDFDEARDHSHLFSLLERLLACANIQPDRVSVSRELEHFMVRHHQAEENWLEKHGGQATDIIRYQHTELLNEMRRIANQAETDIDGSTLSEMVRTLIHKIQMHEQFTDRRAFTAARRSLASP